MRVLIDGHPVDSQEASVSVFDWGLLRGDGVFEAIRSYGGRLFALDEHLVRLQRSAQLMQLDLPDLDDLSRWAGEVAEDGRDCTVRILVTRGGYEPDVNCPSRVIVLWQPVLKMPPALSILPTVAPWQAGGHSWDLMGAKTLSYAPNMSAWRTAKGAGYDDALLLSREAWVLEGPTFSIGWVVGEIVETPSLDLGILASITRRATIEEAERLGLKVEEARFGLDRLMEADEVFAMSTPKEVMPVGRVGMTEFEVGPITRKLASAFRARVVAETS